MTETSPDRREWLQAVVACQRVRNGAVKVAGGQGEKRIAGKLCGDGHSACRCEPLGGDLLSTVAEPPYSNAPGSASVARERS